MNDTNTKANEELIITLILQDLKHNQLTYGLEKLSLKPGIHCLDIIEVVAQLMGIPKEEISEQFREIYYSFLKQAIEIKISANGEELKPLAEKCYYLISSCQEIEERSKKFTYG